MFEFDFSLLLRGQYHEMLVAGLLLSLKLAAVTLVFAVPLAMLVALLRLAPFRALQWLGFAYVESIRNVPLLAHMLFWYFAAFMSEDMRSGIRAVPTVQLEAARALGFGYLASMRLVILPQALRITVPPLISQTLNLWKNTSIATVIGVAELMYQAGQVESSTFRSFESFAFATAAYLSVSLLITGAAAWYQQRYPGVERR
ncbi:amino acid ABC transporter permease [Pseudomonas aeruginosa]|nr:amino acid ABC transporter permease [Pseudomonas aeruginosa]